MKLFSLDYLSELTTQARDSARLRQHRNIHQTFQEPCQRLFNAIEPGSYIRPHRHTSDPRDELLIAIRGLVSVILFDDNGCVTNVVCLGTERYGHMKSCVAAEIPFNVWHTVTALSTDCVLLEIKSGPFDPDRPKDLALWAPEEGSTGALDYLDGLKKHVKEFIAFLP